MKQNVIDETGIDTNKHRLIFDEMTGASFKHKHKHSV